MKGIRNWFEKRKKDSEELKEKQEKCKHEWIGIHVRLEYGNYSLIGLITGPTKFVLDTNGEKCKICGKDIFANVEVD